MRLESLFVYLCYSSGQEMKGNGLSTDKLEACLLITMSDIYFVMKELDFLVIENGTP